LVLATEPLFALRMTGTHSEQPLLGRPATHKKLSANAVFRSDRLRFEVHLSGCPDCTEYLRQMRMTIAVTGRLEMGDPSPELQRQFTALYRRWKLEAG
jgi:hypothetical protein